MERNLQFETAGLKDIVVHLAWAQLEIFADDVEKIQVLAAGDEGSVSDLRILVEDNALIVEQPQYGLSLNIMESRWMQICIRVPRSWENEVHVSTISGLLSARGLNGHKISMDTVSGDLKGVRLTAKKLSLKTISGDVGAETLCADVLSVRSVSGDLSLEDIDAVSLKCNSVSGEQTYGLKERFQRMDVNAVSGDVIITSPHKMMNVSLRSISGRVRTEGVDIKEDESLPTVRVTGVSADLKLISI